MAEKTIITDIHTHILPGIDDGAKDWDTSLAMIQKSWDLGVRNIIATPHYFPWEPSTTPEMIHSLCEEATEKTRNQLGIDMKIYPGQEVYYHMDMIENLQAGKIQTMNDSDCILVEFDTSISWQNMKYGIHSMIANGYKPVIAHLERYQCLRKDGYIDELLKENVLLQMNIRSVVGGLFNRRVAWCHKYVKQGQIDFLASDMHNTSTRAPFSEEGLQWVHKKLKKDSVELMLNDKAVTYFNL